MARKKSPSKKTSKKRGRSKKNVVTVDFTGVESGGGIPTPDGIYIGEVVKAEQEVSSTGNDMISVVYKTNIGSRVYHHYSLQPQALFNLKTALECMGYEVPDSSLDVDVDALVGESCGLDIQNETYEEKDRPKVVGHLPLEVAEEEIEKAGGKPTADQEEEEEGHEEEGEEEEEEEEAPAPKKKASKKKSKKKAASKKVTALRPGARVTFEDEDGEEYEGVIEGLEDDMAVVVDDEEGEWEIPVAELTKA